MEYKFLYRYLQYKKAKEISFKEYMRNSSKIYKGMLILMIVSLICILIIDKICPYSYLIFIPLTAEILAIIVIDIGMNLDAKRKSKNNLKKLDEECCLLLEWLKENGFGEKML